MVYARTFGALIGAIWASLFLIYTESTLATFLPFILIALAFLVIFFVCLRDKLQPHASFAIKR